MPNCKGRVQIRSLPHAHRVTGRQCLDERLKYDLAGHTISKIRSFTGVFASIFMLSDRKSSSSVTVTSHTFMNFTGEGAHMSSAPARRQHALHIVRFPTQQSSCLLLVRFSNHCILLCHNCRVLIRNSKGFSRLSGAPQSSREQDDQIHPAVAAIEANVSVNHLVGF